MDYKSSIVISREITSGLLAPWTPLQDFEKFFFKIYLLKLTSINKSNTLITNIAILKSENIVFKN